MDEDSEEIVVDILTSDGNDQFSVLESGAAPEISAVPPAVEHGIEFYGKGIINF